MRWPKVLVFLSLICACKNTNSPETPKDTAIEVDSLVNVVEKQEAVNYLYAKVDKLRLRNKPGTKGTVVEQIKEGARMENLGEISDFEDRVKLRDEWVKARWMKVRSEQGNEGWVFGGAVTEVEPKPDFTKSPYDDCELQYVKSRAYDAYFKCYDKISSEQLKDNRYIKETSTGYQVTLLSGETRNLVNANGNDNTEGFREYAYRFYLKRMGYFVFRINRYESGSFILMDDKFGYVQPVQGMPRISPDFKKILITNSDTGAGFEFNGIKLFERTDNGMEVLYQVRLEHYGPHNPVWLDDKNIEFDFLSPLSSDKVWRVKAKLSQDEFGEWSLTIADRRE